MDLDLQEKIERARRERTVVRGNSTFVNIGRLYWCYRCGVGHGDTAMCEEIRPSTPYKGGNV